jgi:hypothetical protein
MNSEHFFGCILAAASMAVWPEKGLAHGSGGHGGGGGGHGFGGPGGGHAFVGGGHEFGGFTDRGFSPGFRGTRAFSSGSFSGPRDHGGFGERGFRGRDRDFRDFAGDSFDLRFYGFGYPDYYPYDQLITITMGIETPPILAPAVI